jgi:hypothetical protein
MKTNANNRPSVVDQPIPSIPHQGVEILLADASVAQLHVLLEGLRPGVEVHLISAHDDALELFTQCCLRADLDTLHILGHGAPGEVILGSQKLDQSALVSIQEQLVSRRKPTQFSDHLNGDYKAPDMSSSALQMINQNTILDTQICLWSCQTGAGSQGEQFMNTLANITNSTIFATEQLVGNQSKGGTWNLEKSASPRRAAPFSAEARDGFEGVLASSITLNLPASLSDNYLNAQDALAGLTITGSTSELAFYNIPWNPCLLCYLGICCSSKDNCDK